MDTNTPEYANYLINRQKSLRSLLFQLPYQLHLRLLRLGRTLEIGCGAGRNLKTCSKSSVGVDHNPYLVKACREMNLNAFSADEWLLKGPLEFGKFDSLLIAHVAEHMGYFDFVQLLKKYVPYLRTGGRIVIICPQEKGFQSDATHVLFMDFEKLKNALGDASHKEKYELKKRISYSFPFPRLIGKIFPYNEFVVIASKEQK